MKVQKLLEQFAHQVASRLGVDALSVLLCPEPVGAHDLMLAHSHGAPALPELASADVAGTFVRAAGPSTSPVVMYAGATAGALVSVTLRDILTRSSAVVRTSGERRREPGINNAPETDGSVWFGLSDAAAAQRLCAWLEEDSGADASWLRLTTRLAWSSYQLADTAHDPVSQLHERIELQLFLNRAIAAAQAHNQALSVLLLNPDDFSMINHRYGRDQGDLAIREVATTLLGCLRKTDGVFRYAGAIFGVVMPATDSGQCQQAIRKLRQQLDAARFVDGAEQLTFSMGATTWTPVPDETHEVDAATLLRCADTALNRARLSGGAQAVASEYPDGMDTGNVTSPLHGVFTTDTEKDYRNMLLLWETIGLIGAGGEPDAMAGALVDRLALGFQPDRIVLLQVANGTATQPVATNVRDPDTPDGRASGRELEIGERQRRLVDAAVQSRRTERLRDEDGGAYTAYAVPLLTHDQAIACLFLDARGRRLQLDSSDVVFLNALASQMAVALDRARLAAGWIEQKDRESRALREQLDELKQSLHHDRMIYESAEMHALMDTLQRVAPSDATVLVTGESGTGKEMLAHSVHQYSNRSQAPFIIFDCGAVAPSLLEAELFGHIKGAFTGAERASEGRIAQADGGTLFLDEIGELPLQVQAKLLRFVQEKMYAPVGSAQDRRVDVRIVAATNRRLQDEVARGAFRGDLYYRLQVISLNAIPLRHRPADILPLARHYLARYALQNGVAEKALEPAAEAKLLAYSWPGNVRELQHAMLRAVLTSDQARIEPDCIELLPEGERPLDGPPLESTVNKAAETSDPTQINAASEDASASPSDPIDSQRGESATVDVSDPWIPLKAELLRQIRLAMDSNREHPVPIGRWLTEDLVIAASEASNQVARRAADLVGLPESTFRRQLQKTEAERAAGIAGRTSAWDAVLPLVNSIVRKAQEAPGSVDLVSHARSTLLDSVLGQVDGRISTGAALMGVSPPTYKRWLRDQHGGQQP